MSIGPHGGIYLCVRGPVASVNSLSKNNFRPIANEVATWREAFYWTVKAFRPDALDYLVAIHVYHLKNKRLDVSDAGSIYFAGKGAVDGIVDGGLLTDDNPEHVHSVTLYAPSAWDYEGLGVELVPV